MTCRGGVLACGPNCRAGDGQVPRTGTLRGAGGSDSRPGTVQTALFYCLSKQRIDVRWDRVSNLNPYLRSPLSARLINWLTLAVETPSSAASAVMLMPDFRFAISSASSRVGQLASQSIKVSGALRCK